MTTCLSSNNNFGNFITSMSTNLKCWECIKSSILYLIKSWWPYFIYSCGRNILTINFKMANTGSNRIWSSWWCCYHLKCMINMHIRKGIKPYFSIIYYSIRIHICVIAQGIRNNSCTTIIIVLKFIKFKIR